MKKPKTKARQRVVARKPAAKPTACIHGTFRHLYCQRCFDEMLAEHHHRGITHQRGCAACDEARQTKRYENVAAATAANFTVAPLVGDGDMNSDTQVCTHCKGVHVRQCPHCKDPIGGGGYHECAAARGMWP